MDAPDTQKKCFSKHSFKYITPTGHINKQIIRKCRKIRFIECRKVEIFKRSMQTLNYSFASPFTESYMWTSLNVYWEFFAIMRHKLIEYLSTWTLIQNRPNYKCQMNSHLQNDISLNNELPINRCRRTVTGELLEIN